MSAVTHVPSPPDGVQRLGRLKLFASMPPAALGGLANEGDWLEVPGGAVLFRQGDPAEGLYVVVSGRLRATTNSGAVLAELGRGEPVGELGLLVDEPRSATVQAMRDSILLRITTAGFERLVAEAPRAMLPLAHTVARRLVDSQAGRRATSPITAVVVISLLDSRAHSALLDALGAEVLAGNSLADDDDALLQRVDADDAPGVLLLDVGAEPSAWASRCLRQADRVLLLVDGTSRATLGSAAALFAELDESGCRPSEELVLVHPADRSMPRGTAAWLALRSFAGHHHVRHRVSSDTARLSRHLHGRSAGLVLGGGGSRCFAHIGAFGALRDADIPIDHVGGSSLGAVMAAQVAAGWSPEEMHEVNRREWQAAAINRRYTLPLVSLLSVRTAIPMFERMFGETNLEDLWLPCFATTADLSSCQVVAQRRGPTALWVRASASPPGIWPPVLDEEGHLHVDGGVLDNLPAQLMRQGQVGHIATVNVSPYVAMVYDGADAAPSTAGAWLRAWYTRRRATAVVPPNIVRILYRTAIVTSLGVQAAARAASDLYVQPELSAYGLSDYHAIDDIVAAGESEARRQIIALDPPPSNWA